MKRLATFLACLLPLAANAEIYKYGKFAHTNRFSRERMDDSYAGSSNIVWHDYEVYDGTNKFDLSPAGNHGHSTGSQEPVSTNGVLVYDGSDDRLLIDPDATLNTTNITLMCDMKPTTDNAVQIFLRASGNRTYRYFLQPYGSWPGLEFHSGGGLRTAWSGHSITWGGWNHLAATVEATNASGCAVRFYHNGVFKRQEQHPIPVTTAGKTWYLGYDWEFPSVSFIGTQRCVRIWNFALNTTQISNEYQRAVETRP